MRISLPILSILISILLASAASAQKDMRESKDHPLIARYPGTYIKDYTAIEYDRSALITGPFQKDSEDNNTTHTQTLEGQVVNHQYVLKKGGDQFLTAVKNYQSAFERLNATMIYTCLDADTCNTPASAEFEASNYNEFRQDGIPFLSGISLSNRYNYAVITAEFQNNGATTTAMVMISAKNDLVINQSIVAQVPFDDQKIAVGNLSDLPKVVSDPTRVRKDQVKQAKDHPLLKRYPGFYITDYTQVEFDKSRILTGPITRVDAKGSASKQEAPFLELEGQVTNIAYKSDDTTASTYQILLNYRVALQKLGAEIIYSCETTNDCTKLPDGTGDNRIDKNFWQLSSFYFKGIKPVGGTDTNFVTAKLEQGETTVHFMIASVANHANGTRIIYESIIVDAPFDPNKVGIGSIEDLTISIADSGAVVLEGVLFEFDSDQLLPESGVVLDIVNEYINQNDSTEFFVVGHTDSTGKYAYNVELSKRRAASVVKYLTQNGADSKRLLPVGVGSVSPIANNETEVGQKSNRRVELVIR